MPEAPPVRKVTVPTPGGHLAAAGYNPKGFLSLSGGSILYCLSAMSILYGITQLAGPVFAQSAQWKDALPCLGALNVYELALLATLLYIVVIRHVTDDAISIVLLIPLFVVASGIALDTVSAISPRHAIAIGGGCVILGLGKLLALRHAIRLPWGPVTMFGLILIVCWNFLTGPFLMRFVANNFEAAAAKRTFWLESVLLLFVSGAFALLESGFRKTPSTADAVPDTPFLRTRPMAGIFVLMLFAAAAVHLYAIGFIFNVRHVAGDFILLFTLGTLMLLETLRGIAKTPLPVMGIVASIPLVGCLQGLREHVFIAPFSWSLELLGHPMLALAVGGLGMLWLATRTRWRGFLYLAAAYGLGVVLTAGFDPTSYASLNGLAVGAILATGLFALGLALKQPALCVIAVTMAAVGLCSREWFSVAMESVAISTPGGVAGFMGLSLLLIYGIFRVRTLMPIGCLGAALLVGCVFDFLLPVPGWRDVAAFLALGAVGGLLWWSTRCLPTILVLGVPIIARVWLLFRGMSAWRFIILSFILLAAGAWVSSTKGRKENPPPPPSPPPPPVTT